MALSLMLEPSFDTSQTYHNVRLLLPFTLKRAPFPCRAAGASSAHTHSMLRWPAARRQAPGCAFLTGVHLSALTGSPSVATSALPSSHCSSADRGCSTALVLASSAHVCTYGQVSVTYSIFCLMSLLSDSYAKPVTHIQFR